MVNLARGTRDFLPEQAAARHAVMDRLRAVFARHGFEPLETPAFERIETLTGKYGEEGQRLIYQILKRGEGGERGEVDLALRYDLTVPLARVIAMNPGLPMPFKRWQMAPVWRADRPAKGRFREFWQCDCDIVGTAEPLADASCLAVGSDALTTLGFSSGVAIRLNDRRVLSATARACGVPAERETGLFVAIDKLDKIGRDGVDAELAERGIPEDARARLWAILSIAGTRDEIVAGLRAALPEAGEALDYLVRVVALAEALGVPADRIRVDPTLARGLDYYTGPIWEIDVETPKIGSLGGGGRYDGLIGMFGKVAVPAVGISFGLERMITVMEEHHMLPERAGAAQILVAVFDPTDPTPAARAAAVLRAAGFRADLYTGNGKLKAQFKRADTMGAAAVVIAGPSEAARGVVALKLLATQAQEEVPLGDLAARLVSLGITPMDRSPHPS